MIRDKRGYRLIVYKTEDEIEVRMNFYDVDAKKDTVTGKKRKMQI